MGEPSMPQKVAVWDAEPKTNDVEIRSNRAHGSSQPDPFGDIRRIEAGCYPEGGDAV
jgi:hypothetical protein